MEQEADRWGKGNPYRPDGGKLNLATIREVQSSLAITEKKEK